MIHIIKGFSVVMEAEVDVFLELPFFFYDLVDVSNLISDSSTFSFFFFLLNFILFLNFT